MTAHTPLNPTLQVGDVIWRTRKGWAHGDRPFIVFKIISDSEALAVPTSTTVDVLGRMPAIKAGNKASWVNPVGTARVRRNRYQVTRRLSTKDQERVQSAFRIFKKAEPRLYKELMRRVDTPTSLVKSGALKAWEKQYEAIKAWEEQEGRAWPHRIPTKPAQ
jgi:hypothetical protein